MKHYSTYQSQFIEMFGSASKVSINNLVDTTWGSSPDSKTYNDTGDGVPFYQGKTEFGDLYINEPTTYCTAPIRLAKEHDILMSVRAPVGSVNIATQDCCIGRGLASITPKEGKSTTMFVFYALRYMEDEIERLGTGSTFKAINKDSYAKIQMPNVNIEQQQEFVKIAEQADKSKFSNLKSQFIEMFGTLDNPKGEIESLGSVCNIQRGGSPRPISEYITDQSDGLNWIKIGDTDDSMYITKTEEKIKPSGLRKTRQVYAGDLLLSNSMSFGRPYILKIDGCIHDGWLVLHINDAKKLSPVYLCSYLSQQGTYAEMTKLAAGGVVQNLNSNIVKQLDVIVPDMEEQIKYIQILEQADKSKLIQNTLLNNKLKFCYCYTPRHISS